jgi:predicted AlkP superfamily pyrophosphatase or phosphodiesterase
VTPSATRSASSAIAVAAVAAVALALIRSIAAVWFSSDVVATAANTEVAAPRLTARVLVVIVDGLRHDTALESGAMPKLQALARDGAHGVSLASRVTMTGLGVRTLGTGTSPGLADILLETELPHVTFDNVFSSLRRRGGHIAWIGNSAWKELFGPETTCGAPIP